MGRPATSPVGVVGFLNGRDVPVVEPLGMDQGDMLAYRWRCYHDFGFAFADWRCGVRCTGK